MVETFQDLRRRAEALAECSPPSARPLDVHEVQRELLRVELELEERRRELAACKSELSLARAQYRDVCELAPVGYLVLGPRGIEECNQALALLLDTTREDLVGRDVAEFVSEADREDFAEHCRAVLGSSTVRSCELTLCARAGACREVRLHSARAGEGEQLRMAVLDVSDERRLAKQLIDRSGSDELGPGLRALVHDLKHVLMTVVATTDRALTRVGDETSRKLLSETKRVALHGGSLIREALQRPRLTETNPEVTELKRAIEHMAPLIRQLAGSSVSVQFELGSAGARVNISHGELVQLLSNLVVNARDAMSQGGQIHITICDAAPEPLSRRRIEERDYVVLMVSDTGPGMSEAALAHAFEPYFTTKPLGQGTGLGLSTVYSIVKRAGGDVQIHSERGRGTTICMQLPRQGSAPARRRMHTPVPLPASDPSWSEATGSQRPTVLVAEDDAATLLAYEELLSLKGFEVVGAAFASEALRVFEREPSRFLALVCDLELNDMDGAELVRRVRELRGDLSVFVVSGMMPGEPIVKQVSKLPRCELLTKPIEIAELAERLKRLHAST